MTALPRNITFDCADPYLLVGFWSQVTGYREDPENPNEPGDPEGYLAGPGGQLPIGAGQGGQAGAAEGAGGLLEELGVHGPEEAAAGAGRLDPVVEPGQELALAPGGGQEPGPALGVAGGGQ